MLNMVIRETFRNIKVIFKNDNVSEVHCVAIRNCRVGEDELQVHFELDHLKVIKKKLALAQTRDRKLCDIWFSYGARSKI